MNSYIIWFIWITLHNITCSFFMNYKQSYFQTKNVIIIIESKIKNHRGWISSIHRIKENNDRRINRFTSFVFILDINTGGGTGGKRQSTWLGVFHWRIARMPARRTRVNKTSRRVALANWPTSLIDHSSRHLLYLFQFYFYLDLCYSIVFRSIVVGRVNAHSVFVDLALATYADTVSGVLPEVHVFLRCRVTSWCAGKRSLGCCSLSAPANFLSPTIITPLPFVLRSLYEPATRTLRLGGRSLRFHGIARSKWGRRRGAAGV